jgi:hypothetical protein
LHFSPVSYNFVPLAVGPGIIHSTLLKHSVCILPLMWETMFHTHTKLPVLSTWC